MILKKLYNRSLKVLSAERLTTSTTTDNSLSPSIKWYENSNFCLICEGSCLKQKSSFYSSKYNNFFIVYASDTWSRDLNSAFTLKDCLFGGAKLAENANADK